MKYSLLIIGFIFTGCAVNTHWYERPKLDEDYVGSANAWRDQANSEWMTCQQELKASLSTCNRYAKLQDWGTGIQIVSGLGAVIGGSTVIATDEATAQTSAGSVTAVLGLGALSWTYISNQLNFAENEAAYCTPFLKKDSALAHGKWELHKLLRDFGQNYASRDSLKSEIQSEIASIMKTCRD